MTRPIICLIISQTATAFIGGKNVIEVSWTNLDNQEVLQYRFPNLWTWEDFYKAQRKIDKMLDLSSQSIPVFFDFRSGSYLPPGMLREMSNIIETWHPRGTP